MKKTLVSMAAILAATSAFAESHAMDLPQAGSDWYTAGQSHIEAMLARQPNTGRAKNVIVFVADGNGVGTNYAVRLFDGSADRVSEMDALVAYLQVLGRLTNLPAQIQPVPEG